MSYADVYESIEYRMMIRWRDERIKALEATLIEVLDLYANEVEVGDPELNWVVIGARALLASKL